MQVSENEIALMSEALALAARARGWVEPNPMVGCVILKNGKVIGRGRHERFGQPHAEPNALANCSESPEGATAIVTLEPCCHTNKKTPPCVPAIIAAGIKRVIIGQIDPNPAVSGRGAQQLREAGVEVISSALQDRCSQLNAPFFALTRLNRPYITLKWAQSSDGLMGGTGRARRQISSPRASALVQMLRTRSDAIAVSSDTVITDDPLLIVRDVPIIRTPIRIILDTHLRTPPTARLLTDDSAQTIIFTAVPRSQIANQKSKILPLPSEGDHIKFSAVLQSLATMHITHLLIEPGSRLAHSFIAAGQFDRIWVIRSDNAIDEPDAPRAPEIDLAPTATRRLGSDTISEYVNPRSPAYFGNFASPEFTLEPAI